MAQVSGWPPGCGSCCATGPRARCWCWPRCGQNSGIELTARPPGGADPHAQARELLTGHNIPVPAAFTGEQLRDLEGAGDPRLAQAAAGSRDGQVIQYLAGAPELLDRYHHAPPAAQALIHAAIDARRLGMSPAPCPRPSWRLPRPGT